MVSGLETNLKYGMERVVIATPKLISMLRQAADMMEQERKFEYAVEYSEFPGKWEVYKDGLTLVDAQKLSSESWSNPHRIVRREVGEWEEVEDEE